MTDLEIEEYFKTAVLPETLRMDRATTQHEVKDAVKRNIELMKTTKDGNARHRLLQIKNALEHPYDGPEIPSR